MLQKVNYPAALPTVIDDATLLQQLQKEMTAHAYRINQSAPLDGSEPFTAAPTVVINGVTYNIGRQALLGNLTLFVNASTGSDTTGTGSASKPYLTIQKAINVALTLDLNGFAITISVATGTYAGFTVPSPFVGGLVHVVGNTGTPANVVVGAITASNQAVIGLSGIRVSNLSALSGAVIRREGYMQFNGATGIHLYAFGGQIVGPSVPYDIVAGTNSFHSLSDGFSLLDQRSCVITLTPGATYWNTFAFAARTGVNWFQGNTFVGTVGTSPDPTNIPNWQAVSVANGVVTTGNQFTTLPGVSGTRFTSTGGVIE